MTTTCIHGKFRTECAACTQIKHLVERVKELEIEVSDLRNKVAYYKAEKDYRSDPYNDNNIGK